MAANFPISISNEPPPLDADSCDDDSEEFGDLSIGLKLDISGKVNLRFYRCHFIVFLDFETP